MDGSQNIFASSKNQQINSENIEENASCNICRGTYEWWLTTTFKLLPKKKHKDQIFKTIFNF